MHKLSQFGTLLAALCLFFGWSIGSGFFGIPISSGSSGFFPSIAITILVALYVLPSALLYAEAILAFPDGVNIVSLCKKSIGPIITLCIALLFFYLHYYYIASYFHDLPFFLKQILPPSIPLSQTMIKFILFFILLITLILGIKVGNRLNIVFIIAFLLTTGYYLLLQINHISPEFLLRMNWALAFLSIPTYIGNYYFHSLLPTLSTYVNRNRLILFKTILYGLLIFFLFTLLWQFLIFGSISESQLWIANGGFNKTDQNIDLPQATETLTYLFHSLLFFSIFTTLLVGSFVIRDALFDGLRIPLLQRKGIKKWGITILALLPSLLFSFSSEEVLWLDNFTGWGELFLIGPLPIWLVWNIRYNLELSTHPLLPGGRLALFLYGIVNFIVFYIQAANLIWTTTLQ